MSARDEAKAAEPCTGAAFGRCSRGRFLRAATLAAFGTAAGMTALSADRVLEHRAPSVQDKGRKGSKVTRWDVITIGNLSRNCYWGESDEKAFRSAICTCTVVQGEGFRLIVDPSLSNAEEMAKELDRRTGLNAREITTAFITHEHADHWFGLAHFPEAQWLAAPGVAQALNRRNKLPKAVEAVTGGLFEVIDILPTPGHTLTHHSLRFDCDGKSVVLAGDAVATQDFWRERRGYYNCADFALSARSMDKIAELADVVVPGHDNFFLVTHR